MPYESPLQYFRDIYKNPDRHPENKEIIEIDENEEYSENISKNNEKEQLTGAGETYRKTINTIKNSDLKEEFKNDEEEKKILENRKELTLKYLKKIMEDARNYLTQVNYLELQKAASYDSIAKYQEAVGESDAMRRSYHNTMISDIKIAMRLINNNFNIDFPEEIRLKEEANAVDRKHLSLEQLKNKMNERVYSSFDHPVGAFIDFSKTPKDPQGEREYIAYWALKLYNDLSVLEKEFDK
jgi:hypothetical protein